MGTAREEVEEASISIRRKNCSFRRGGRPNAAGNAICSEFEIRMTPGIDESSAEKSPTSHPKNCHWVMATAAAAMDQEEFGIKSAAAEDDCKKFIVLLEMKDWLTLNRRHEEVMHRSTTSRCGWGCSTYRPDGDPGA
ncbi:UNVERIFIED_CONTAM: hypothetical protein PYX00_007273 [Menopon gallinae]|uniref:Uncharacterized protein n=1 Tax=Menopon gallinae TaxID=328185 RepID=A0AAW2HIH9_9NEOP